MLIEMSSILIILLLRVTRVSDYKYTKRGNYIWLHSDHAYNRINVVMDRGRREGL